ncbi:MAG: hypothetical protein WC829_00370 [Hyphomicrobium sp.]|jgi:hypothetical protein
MVGEQDPLKRRQVVEELLRRRVLHLRVSDERTERLLLERREARVQLVATPLIRAALPRNAGVRPVERKWTHARAWLRRELGGKTPAT